jgi:hypothetical protein
MRDHHRSGLRCHRHLRKIDVDVVRLEIDVDKDRHTAVLYDRRDGSREARRTGDHLVTRLQATRSMLGRGERRES